MAYTGTICTEAEIALMVGENVDATGDTEANHNDLVAQAESYLSNLLRYNVVDNYSALNADVKRTLSEWAARYAASSLILYNMSGFTSRGEGEDMVNFHIWRMKKIEELLVDQNTVTYIKGA
tara:strand:+ start:163 stop:528 length:366 start_codon:yes stop_codon:yes gene_type:complete